MKDGFWLYPPERFEADESGAVAVVEFCDESGSWQMTGIVVNSYYGTAQDPLDGIDQLIQDIRKRGVHRRGLESCQGIERVQSDTYDTCEEADEAARRWLNDHTR